MAPHKKLKLPELAFPDDDIPLLEEGEELEKLYHKFGVDEDDDVNDIISGRVGEDEW
jgi:hypothetical protein